MSDEVTEADGEGDEPESGEFQPRSDQPQKPRKKRPAPTDGPAQKKADKPPSDLERLLGALVIFKIFKKHKKKTIFFSVVLFLGFLIYWGIQPRTGSMRYGLCLEFARTMVRYPQTLQPVSVYEAGPIVSLDYSFRDPFGNFKSERLDCRFGNGANGELVLSKAILMRHKRLPVDQDKVDAFSRTLPAVIAGKPNLVLPVAPGESLESLKIR